MKATILLISCYPGIRDSLGQTLRLEGCNVTLADNGQEALQALRGTGFDLVLLDLDLPAGDLWGTLCRMVTNSVSLPAILSFSLPVIIITARSDQQFLAAEKGVAAVYEKPLRLPLLLEGIKRALAQKATARRQRPETGHEAPAPSSDGGGAAVAKSSR
jgi:CheY-like chemotaxis protein